MLLNSWLIHACTRARRTSVSSKGDPTYGSQATFRARVEKESAVVTDRAGKEVSTSYVLATTTEIAYDDRIWLPAIDGEPADDTSALADAHLPVSITNATTKLGTQGLWIVRFA